MFTSGTLLFDPHLLEFVHAQRLIQARWEAGAAPSTQLAPSKFIAVVALIIIIIIIVIISLLLRSNVR